MSSQTKPTLAISTCLASKRLKEAAEVLAVLERCGLRHLELDYRFTHRAWLELVKELRPRGLVPVSLHNYTPLPPDLPWERASGDLFNLAASDREERRLAVRHTLSTLEWASELEAGAVVLHLGWVEGARDKKLTLEAAKKGGLTPELEAHLQKRAALAGRALDAVSFSLEEIIRRAEPLGLVLGLENRAHACEVPTLEELALLLERFAGAPLGLWYDLGHAMLLDKAGVTPAGRWLAELGGSLAGCHLHDIKGVQDHLPPGAGELDWDQVAADLWRAPRLVLEVHPGPEPEEVGRAAAELARHLDRAQEAERKKEAKKGGSETDQ